jgi:hypothetical protein
MSGFVKAGFSFLKNLGKGQKTTGTEVISNIGITKNLATKRKIQDNVTEAVDSAFKKADLPPSVRASMETKNKKAALKRDEGKKLKGLSYKLDKLEEKVKKKFNKGGRVGLKSGTQLSPKQMKIASLAGNKKKIDKPDFKKLRAMKSPMDKAVRKS